MPLVHWYSPSQEVKIFWADLALRTPTQGIASLNRHSIVSYLVLTVVPKDPSQTQQPLDGPVRGTDLFFWRRGAQCRNSHILAHLWPRQRRRNARSFWRGIAKVCTYLTTIHDAKMYAVSLKCRQRKKALASPFPLHHVPPPLHASPLHNVIITTGRTLRQLVQQ